MTRSRTAPISEAMLDPNLLGASLGTGTWQTWQAVLKAAFAEPLTPDEETIFKAVSGGRSAPLSRVSELWVIAGRRGGKTRMAALISAYLATCVDHSSYLAPGEIGSVLCLAPTQRQAQGVLGYAKAMLEESPVLARRIDSITSEEIRLKRNVSIAVHPANFRTVRGRTLLAAVMDETALWRDETSSLPDVEALRALLPALMTTKGMVVGISTPYAQRGLLFEKYRDHYGRDSEDVLVVKGTTRQFNPTADEAWIAKQIAADPEAATAEYEAEFRGDWTGYVDRETLAACIDVDVRQRAPVIGKRYVAFLDPSGGKHDSMTLAISHKEGERIVLDVAHEWAPPFDPTVAVEDVVATLRKYHCTTIISDRYASGWVEGAFKRFNVHFKPSKGDKSLLFLEALPHFTSAGVALLDNTRLISQLTQLQREAGRGGRDRVVKMRGGHDDLANAVCGAIAEVNAKFDPARDADGFGAPPKVVLGYANTKRQGRTIKTNRNGRMTSSVRRLVEEAAELEAHRMATERQFIDDTGAWIQHMQTANDGREQFAIFDPNGTCRGNLWGKDAAETAARQLIEEGRITR